MKTLLLLRHAKSSWDDASVRDFDRVLAARGERDAPRMGKALAERGPLPDHVVSSPAARARQTTGLFVEAAGFDFDPAFEPAIYDATSAELMKVVRNLPDERDTVLMVGHNPGFEELLSRLTGESHAMPTAALACIALDAGHWEDVEDGGGKLQWLLTPKQLDA